MQITYVRQTIPMESTPDPPPPAQPHLTGCDAELPVVKYKIGINLTPYFSKKLRYSLAEGT